jgi:uncharacterized membrane protein YgdD (TMEM256/DUF423 family)
MTSSQKWLFIVGAFMGFLAVAAGAFGAHALKQKLEPEMLSVFEVGARYHIYHALAICLTALAISIIPGQLMPVAGWLFFAGSIIFSGSLYLLALTGVKILGAITPIGGILLLAGWLSFAIAAFKSY